MGVVSTLGAPTSPGWWQRLETWRAVIATGPPYARGAKSRPPRTWLGLGSKVPGWLAPNGPWSSEQVRASILLSLDLSQRSLRPIIAKRVPARRDQRRQESCPPLGFADVHPSNSVQAIDTGLTFRNGYNRMLVSVYLRLGVAS